jgi:hypothetical protein
MTTNGDKITVELPHHKPDKAYRDVKAARKAAKDNTLAPSAIEVEKVNGSRYYIYYVHVPTEPLAEEVDVGLDRDKYRDDSLPMQAEADFLRDETATELIRLKESIAAVGQAQPIVLDGQGGIVDGRQRLRALRSLRYDGVEVKPWFSSRADAIGDNLEAQFASDFVGRTDLHKQRKHMAQALFRHHNYRKRAIGHIRRKLGVDASTVSDYLKPMWVEKRRKTIAPLVEGEITPPGKRAIARKMGFSNSYVSGVVDDYMAGKLDANGEYVEEKSSGHHKGDSGGVADPATGAGDEADAKPTAERNAEGFRDRLEELANHLGEFDGASQADELRRLGVLPSDVPRLRRIAGSMLELCDRLDAGE